MQTDVRRVPQAPTEQSWPWTAAAIGLVGFTFIAALAVSRSFFRLAVFGVLALALLLGATAYSGRKRAFQERWPGTMFAWLKIHLYAAVAGSAIALVHSVEAEGWGAFSLGGLTSGRIAFWILVLVVLSGAIWRLVYRLLPPKVARQVGNLSIKDTKARLEILDAELDKVQVGRSLAFQRAAEDVRAGRPLAEVEANLKNLPPVEVELWNEVRRLRAEREAAELRRKKQRSLSDTMQVWKVIHIPLAVLLGAVVAYHVIDVYLRG